MSINKILILLVSMKKYVSFIKTSLLVIISGVNVNDFFFFW